MVRYRVITFDAAGTLIRLVRPPGETYSDVASRFGYNFEPARLELGFRNAWANARPPAETRAPRRNDDRDWWQALVRSCLSYAGYSVRPFDQFFDMLYYEFEQPGIWTLTTDALRVLEFLQARLIHLGIISNFDRRLYTILNHLGIDSFFEQVIISSEVGADKPSPYIFRLALERFKVDPSEMLHVGDEEKADGEGSRGAGIDCVVVGAQGLWETVPVHCEPRMIR